MPLQRWGWHEIRWPSPRRRIPFASSHKQATLCLRIARSRKQFDGWSLRGQARRQRLEMLPNIGWSGACSSDFSKKRVFLGSWQPHRKTRANAHHKDKSQSKEHQATLLTGRNLAIGSWRRGSLWSKCLGFWTAANEDPWFLGQRADQAAQIQRLRSDAKIKHQ